MHKKWIIAVCVLIVILFSGCAMNEKLEEVSNRETLIVLRWELGISDFIVRNDVLDEELIKKVNEVFAQVNWQEDDEELIKEVNENEVSSQFLRDRQEDDGRSRPLPQFQIGNYEVWLLDQFVHAVNLEEDTYAKLTAEDSEFILKFLMRIGIAH